MKTRLPRSAIHFLVIAAVAGCASTPPPPPPKGEPLGDEGLLRRVALSLACTVESVDAQVFSGKSVIGEGCGRLVAFERGDDGSWSPLGAAIPLDSDTAIPFTEGMTKPRKVSGNSTPDGLPILKRGTHADFSARCIVTRTGTVTSCQAVESLGVQDQKFIATIESWGMTPATYKDRPIAVKFTFRYRLNGP